MLEFTRFLSRREVLLGVLIGVPALSLLVALLARRRLAPWIPLVAGAVVAAFYFAALAGLSRGRMQSLGESGTCIVLVLLLLVIPVVAGIVAFAGSTRWRRGALLTGTVTPVRATVIVAAYIALIIAVVVVSDCLNWGNYSWRMACLTNIRHVGMACRQYADDHEGRYPASFGALLKEGYLTTTTVFFCPSILTEPPADFPADFKAAPLDALNRIDEASDYVLLHGVDGHTDNDVIVVYERDGAHEGEGRSVFFADGHVRWQNEPKFQDLMRNQRERPGAKDRTKPVE